MARKSYTVAKRRKSMPYRGRKGSSILDIFKVGGTTHRVRTSQGGGTRGIVRDQTGFDWWRKKRG